MDVIYLLYKGSAYNSSYPKGGVSCSKDSFVVNQTLVFQIKFCGKSPALRVAAERYVIFFPKITQMMNYIYSFSFLILLISCSTTKSALNRANNFQNNFKSKVYLNNNLENPIKLDSVYLDRKNISEIKYSKQTNSIIIIQKNKTSKLLSFSEINVEDLSKNSKIESIILNGNVLSENDLRNFKIEETAIKDISILIANDLHKGSYLRENDKKALIIKTKK